MSKISLSSLKSGNASTQVMQWDGNALLVTTEKIPEIQEEKTESSFEKTAPSLVDILEGNAVDVAVGGHDDSIAQEFASEREIFSALTSDEKKAETSTILVKTPANEVITPKTIGLSVAIPSFKIPSASTVAEKKEEVPVIVPTAAVEHKKISLSGISLRKQESSVAPVVEEKKAAPAETTVVATEEKTQKNIESSTLLGTKAVVETQKEEAIKVVESTPVVAPIVTPVVTPIIAPAAIAIGQSEKVPTTQDAEIKEDAAAPTKNAEYFPNLVIGFEEEDALKYIQTVAENLSKTRKGGLFNFIGKKMVVRAMIGVLMASVILVAGYAMLPKAPKIKTSAVESSQKVKPPVKPVVETPKKEIVPETTKTSNIVAGTVYEETTDYKVLKSDKKNIEKK